MKIQWLELDGPSPDFPGSEMGDWLCRVMIEDAAGFSILKRASKYEMPVRRMVIQDSIEAAMALLRDRAMKEMRYPE